MPQLRVAHLKVNLTSADQGGTMKFIQWGEFAMPLRRGDVQGFDFNRMVVEFTMLNQAKVIQCAISTAAMDIGRFARIRRQWPRRLGCWADQPLD
jgi:hypothetical protein